MLPVVDDRGRSTGVQMTIYCCSLVLVSVLPSFPFFGMTGELYLFVAVLLGIVFAVATILAATLRRPSAMRLCFLVSILYLPLLLTVMVVDKIFHVNP